MTTGPAAHPANRLASETSPYLLQHAHDPVDWYPWGEEALGRARAEQKPIFLSIGYAACHWCHVMERESFEDEATAAQLNRDFVAIKVDREERPDLDQVYMAAVQAMTGGGGWPMSVFLTPDGKPFYGGTYFPPEPRHGLPAFRDVLAGVRRAWDEQRAEVEQAGQRLVGAIVDQARPPAGGSAVTEATLEAAVARLAESFDAATGGWGTEPKFPQPMAVEFLLRRAVRGDARAEPIARRTLDAMAAGGIHDQLGGGFHRYATDARWLVPHFEQMLYDNAQLARAYLHAWQLTGRRRWLDVALGTLDFIERELRTADGAFAASLDADTDGVEGGTFVWTAAEVRAALAGLEPDLFCAAYGVTDAGNWEGRTILARAIDDEALAERFGLAPEQVASKLAVMRAELLAARRGRAQPARDDKAIAAWNGLAIGAFADAARALAASGEAGLASRAPALESAATRAARAIVGGLLGPDGRLRRSWKDGRARADGVLEDHACLADGLLSLYEAGGDERWFVAARGLADAILERFAAADGGFFDVAADASGLIARPRDVQDNATPSGGAMATLVLLRLAALTGEARYRAAAEAALRTVGPYLERYPAAFAWWLVAADFAVAPVAEVAVVGRPADPATRALDAVTARGFRPHLVLATGARPSASEVPLLRDRTALDGRPTAYVCQAFACRLPVTEPDALDRQLAEIGAAQR